MEGLRLQERLNGGVMLFDPEKKARLDDNTLVRTGNSERAQSECRKIVEFLQEKGQVVEHVGVRKNKSRRSHQCIQRWEIDE